MSDSDVVMALFVGIIMGSIVTIMLAVNIIGVNSEETIDKVIDNQKDCQIKEYYYMDSHRDFCDRIGVKP
jgi:hypothetical protein